MEKVFLQHWEQSERKYGILPDGCSLHLSIDNYNNYLNDIYSGRDSSNVPCAYDKVVGELIEVEVTPEIYNEILINGGSLRLMHHSLNNLRKLQELKIIVFDESYN